MLAGVCYNMLGHTAEEMKNYSKTSKSDETLSMTTDPDYS